MRRVDFTCAGCGTGEYAADRRIGLQGALSRQGRRGICGAGGRASFAEAAASLREIGGRTVSGETIRRACLAESKAMAAWRAGRGRACEDFRAADGLAEFQSDAAKVNTDTGWRDGRIGIFAEIGSGTVEGAAKLLIGRRLKRTGARWTVANVPATGELCSITDSSCWLAYWDTA